MSSPPASVAELGGVGPTRDMLEAIGQYLCPSFAATFESDYPLVESVQRFEQALAGYTLLDRVAHRALVGDVAGQEVQVYQSGWGGRARYAMAFTGEFRQTEAGVVLAGHFALRAREWVWLSLLLGSMICCSIGFVAILILGAASHPGRDWWAPLLPIGAVVLKVADLVQGQQARTNRRWLSQTIAGILSRPEGPTTRSSERAPRR